MSKFTIQICPIDAVLGDEWFTVEEVFSDTEMHDALTSPTFDVSDVMATRVSDKHGEFMNGVFIDGEHASFMNVDCGNDGIVPLYEFWKKCRAPVRMADVLIDHFTPQRLVEIGAKIVNNGFDRAGYYRPCESLQLLNELVKNKPYDPYPIWNHGPRVREEDMNFICQPYIMAMLAVVRTWHAPGRFFR